MLCLPNLCARCKRPNDGPVPDAVGHPTQYAMCMTCRANLVIAGHLHDKGLIDDRSAQIVYPVYQGGHPARSA